MKHCMLPAFFLLLSMTADPLAAQVESFGIRAGANFSNIATSEYQWLEYSGRTGKTFGVALEARAAKRLALQAELQFVEYGFQADNSRFSTRSERESRYSYLQIPLLAKATFGTDRAGAFLLAGPHLGFGIGRLLDVYVNANDFDIELQRVEYASWRFSRYRSTDFGFTGGLGVYFAAGFGTLAFDARYLHGLSNMIADVPDQAYQRNRSFQLGLSYLVRLRTAAD